MSISRKKMYFEAMCQNTFKAKRLKSIGFSGLALSFGLLACTSNSDTAGGGPSGTEAGNAIIATIYNEDGTPARLAKVTLIESMSLDGEEKGFTTTTDSNGFVSIDSVIEGDYIMEAVLEGCVVQIDVSVTNTDSIKLGEQTLQKPVYMDGLLTDFGCKDCDSVNGTLRFYGLSHSTPVKNGYFSIGGLPSGRLNFVFIPQGGTKNDAINFPTVKMQAGDSLIKKHQDNIPKDTAKIEPKDSIKIVEPVNIDTSGPIETIVLDDFKDGNNKHSFAIDSSFESGCMWYMSTFGNVFITPQLTVENYYNPFLAVVEETDDGHQVHFALTFPDSTTKPPYWTSVKSWANITVQIGKPYTPYNISGLDSIAFEIWGNGDVVFQLADETRKGDSIIVASKHFDLPTEKTRHAIALADIYPVGTTKTATSFVWAFDKNVEVYISKVELIGKNISSFWKEQ